jgi:hypothetical protein
MHKIEASCVIATMDIIIATVALDNIVDFVTYEVLPKSSGNLPIKKIAYHNS